MLFLSGLLFVELYFASCRTVLHLSRPRPTPILRRNLTAQAWQGSGALFIAAFPALPAVAVVAVVAARGCALSILDVMAHLVLLPA